MSDKPDLPPLEPWVEALLPPAPCAHAPRTDQPGPAMTPVTSSNIAEVGHDGSSLWVKFKNDTLYRYPTAGADLHAGMIAASSAGSYFHHHIKSAHKGEKVT
jgi:hypothetical protein